MRWKLLREDLTELPRLIRLGSALRQASAKGRDTLGVLARQQAERHPDRILLRFETETVSYGDFNAGANAFAAVFRELGIGRRPLALMMENSPALLMAQAGVAKLGAVAALVNTHLSGSALDHALRVSGARHVFADQACVAQAAAAATDMTVWGLGDPAGLPPGVEPLDHALAAADSREPTIPDVRGGDEFLYIYTSGTTGHPKPAVIRHSRFTMAGIALGGMLGIGADDVIYAPLPLYHGESNFVGFSVAIRAGAAFASRRRFSAGEFLNDVRRHGATMFVYVGELCRYVLRQPPSENDRDHRLRIAAGAGLRPDIWQAFQTRFGIPRIVEMYGMTEGNVSLMNLDGRPGSVGRPHPFQHRNVRLARYDLERGDLEHDAGGHVVECAVGEAGELLGRVQRGGHMPYDGYTDRAASEGRLIHNAFRRGDAWFRSGDLLRKDADGYYYFVDRLGDTFRWKGENVATLEVAEILNRAPGISETCVYGVAIPGCDGRAGAAAVVLKQPGSIDPAAFYAHAEQTLPAYARPAFVRVLDAMETTGTLKQRKVELQREGFDLQQVSDPIYVRDDGARSYVPLTAELVRLIEQARWRL